MKKIILLSLMTFTYVSAQEIKNFNDIWKKVYEKSNHQKALHHEKEANDLGLERSGRHWLPRAYVGAQWFNTNDPAQTFFNNLGQRSVQQLDFVPGTLNRPGNSTFKVGTLGVDLPLYEGGVKSSQKTMFESMVKASEMELRAKKTEEYTELSRQYGSLLLHDKNAQLLQDLKANLAKIISSYQVGSQSNPVGHSGLLGLKGVVNRIEGMLYEFDMKTSQAKAWINEKTQEQGDWKPSQNVAINDFVQKNLEEVSGMDYSSFTSTQELKSKTLDDVKNMEKARFLPRVGIFAQNNVYDGMRNRASSQTVGLYLMWDLFNNDSYGRVSEADAKSLSAKAKIEAYKQEEKIMVGQLVHAKFALEKNLALLDESDLLLKEQTSNAMKLFRSGMLSALQLSEVINRRVDLIDQRNKAQNQYVDVNSRLYQLNN